MVHLSHDGPSRSHERIGAKRARRQPVLFAIARDGRTIFTSWHIDWRSVFGKAMPADRQVHVRVIGRGGVIEKTVVVEPMSDMHWLTISGLHASYRVEIGYFQPFDIWRSVAMSAEVEMPPQAAIEVDEVELATIPFHLSFHQLSNLFGVTDDGSIAKVVSKFQKRVLNSETPNEPTPLDTQILRQLNVSVPDTATAERDFRNIDTARLARRAHPLSRFAATSRLRGFQANPGS
ncbi:MAG: hypothetical protein ACM3NN_13125 [Nitrospirota bacterium]